MLFLLLCKTLSSNLQHAVLKLSRLLFKYFFFSLQGLPGSSTKAPVLVLSQYLPAYKGLSCIFLPPSAACLLDRYYKKKVTPMRCDIKPKRLFFFSFFLLKPFFGGFLCLHEGKLHRVQPKPPGYLHYY